MCRYKLCNYIYGLITYFPDAFWNLYDRFTDDRKEADFVGGGGKMLSVQTNMLAANASRQLGITTNKNAKSTEKLSSGYRINRAADDAAGLSISEKMRRQMRGLTQAAENAQDGISFVQIGEGALNEVHDMLQRANELAIKAATGTLQDSDRMMIGAEIQQLKAEIDSTARNTTFNEIFIFPENGHSPLATSYMESKAAAVSLRTP